MGIKKDRDVYWASVPSDEIADNIMDKVNKYYEYVQITGRMGLWKRSYAYYYRALQTGARLNPVGEQGELTAICINDFRNLLLHIETIITQQKAAFQAKATNTDVESMAQCELADALLAYYMSEKRLERNFVQAVKESLIFSEGFVRVEWDANGGEVYGQTETGATIYEGDLKYTNYNPFDVIRDCARTTAAQNPWEILRDFQNKFDLVAKFPDLKEKILNDSIDSLKLAASSSVNIWAFEESDNVPVYTLIHAPTPALPNGRYTTCLENGTVMQDGPIPYTRTHVYRITPDEQVGTIFGFSTAFDLLPLQEASDILHSTVITNQSTMGVQNILVPKGHDLSISQLAGGMNMIECDMKMGEPKALQLTATAPEIFNYIQIIAQKAETVSGIDALTRGNANDAIKAGMSGSALALIQSMSIQFNSGLQRSYVRLAEDVGTGSINILKQFASVPRVAEIVGKSKRPLMKEFTGQDLSGVNRVTIDLGNPMTNTVAGKTNMADLFLERGMIENPDQYIQVISTGRLEPVIEGKQAQLLLIKGENEQLAQGVAQRVLATDNHQKHILEHTVILSNPEIRQDPNSPIVVVTLEHIQEHLNMANDPNVQRMMMILHQEAIPPMPIPGMGLAPMMGQEPQQPSQPSMPQPPQGADPASQEAIAQQAS